MLTRLTETRLGRTVSTASTSTVHVKDEMNRSRCFSTFYFLICTFFLSACANHHFHTVAEGPASNAPRYVELLAPKQVATLHFPPGSYPLYAVDDLGYYYRAPQKIAQHTGAGGSVLRDGGIFVSKRNPRKLRGFVYYAGQLTHVGDLSRTRYQFRD